MYLLKYSFALMTITVRKLAAVAVWPDGNEFGSILSVKTFTPFKIMYGLGMLNVSLIKDVTINIKSTDSTMVLASP